MDRRSAGSPRSEGLLKVRITVEGDWHSISSEGIWCEPIQDDQYRVRNIPFYAYGISLDDVIKAKPDEHGLLSFKTIEQQSGNHVYRCLVRRDAPRNASKHLEALNKMDCWYESALQGEFVIYAIDVPSSVNVHAMYKILERGEADLSWSFEEANFVPSSKV